MKGFSADWLGRREPYDARARNPIVLDAVAAAAAGDPSIAIIDLACGTGATRRAISSRLPHRQSWRLVDNDAGLLARAASAGRDIAAVLIDIACDLGSALDGPFNLVTASALLDLVSAAWLGRLAMETAARRLPLYAALTYDGRVVLEPADPFDAGIVEAVNRRQRGDKGFGPALGPTAAAAAIARFEALNYAVVRGTSDWALGAPDPEIQADLLSGWAAAAREDGELTPTEIHGWLARRRAHITAGRSSMRVGHIDFFARPIVTR